MIKQNFQKFLLWLKDHFLFLVEVVIRLSVGIREENKQTKCSESKPLDSHDEGGITHDK